VQRILIGRITATAGAVLALVGTFMPWLRSGTRRRNSYEIFSLVERLGFSRSGAIGWGIRLWPIVPFLLASAVTLLWFPRKWITPVVVALAAVYTGVVSVAVRSAPSSSFIAPQSGSVVTLVGTIVLALAALTLALPRSMRL
jgi:hypothetical protein